MIVTEPPEDDDFADDEQLYEVDEERGPIRSTDIGKEEGFEASRPLYVNALMESPTRRKLLDYFLTLADEDRPKSKAAIAREAGVSRTSIIEHINVLVDLGIVEAIGEERPRYQPNTKSAPFQLCVQLNDALAAFDRGE